MYILSISAFYHDSAAVLIKDGKIVCAIEEERLTRKKHDNAFPYEAINFCLESQKIKIEDINICVFYEKPLLKFERILDEFIKTYPFGLVSFLKFIPEWLNTKLKVENILKKEIGFKKEICYVPHHLSHASAAYYTSNFVDSSVLTVDGVGEYQTIVQWKVTNGKFELIKEINYPDSLGLFYSTFASFLGFKVNEGEYKMMGLSAYGKPVYKDLIRKVIDIKEDGSFSMNQKYFGYRNTSKMWSSNFENLFGKPRKKMDIFTKRHKDLAASVQAVTEEIYFKILNNLYSETKNVNLCMGGGVALNALANGKIYNNTKFKNIHILGSSGDSGGALGAGLYVYHQKANKLPNTKKQTLYLGSEANEKEIINTLNKYKDKMSFEEIKTVVLIKKVAILLSEDKTVGWVQGKCEFGPRALGNRSILANPRLKEMKDQVNVIKKRELFRPFAGSVLQDKVEELFEVPEKNFYNPYMNFCFVVKKDATNKIAAIVHKDNTCRIQTVNREENQLYYDLISEFNKITGIPCVLNTSFNLMDEPLVENVEQAVDDFLKTEMNYLVVGNYFCSKGSQGI